MHAARAPTRLVAAPGKCPVAAKLCIAHSAAMGGARGGAVCCIAMVAVHSVGRIVLLLIWAKSRGPWLAAPHQCPTVSQQHNLLLTRKHLLASRHLVSVLHQKNTVNSAGELGVLLCSIR